MNIYKHIMSKIKNWLIYIQTELNKTFPYL